MHGKINSFSILVLVLALPSVGLNMHYIINFERNDNRLEMLPSFKKNVEKCLLKSTNNIKFSTKLLLL